MRVSYKQANSFFSQLPAEQQALSLHPSYLKADASRDQELEPIYWMYEDAGDCLYYGVHQSQIPGSDYFDLQSPYGYGGPQATSTKTEFLSKAWHAFNEDCREQGVVAEFVRFHPLLENWKYYQGTVLDDRETVWIDLSQSDLLSNYSGRVRTAIKKSQKNDVTLSWVEKLDFVAFFPEFYRTEMKAIAADEFYHFSDEYFENLLEMENLKFAVCQKNKEVIAAAIFLFGQDIIEYHLSCANEFGKKHSASNIMLHEAALLGKEEGRKRLYLGGGTAAGENNPLFFFKRGFSKQRAAYKIGKVIHDKSKYKELIELWPDKFEKNRNRILFYR